MFSVGVAIAEWMAKSKLGRRIESNPKFNRAQKIAFRGDLFVAVTLIAMGILSLTVAKFALPPTAQWGLVGAGVVTSAIASLTRIPFDF
jgi:hypothetical protein